MANIKCLIVPAKALKGGKHKVRISVSHNGETRYILTDVILDSEKEFKNGQVVKRPDAAIKNTKLRELLIRYQSSIDSIDYLDGISCAELVEIIKNKKNKKITSLKDAYEEYLSFKIAKNTSIKTYRYQFNSITKYIDENVFVKDITRNHILTIKKAMSDKHLSNSTINNLLSFFKCVMKHASDCGYITHNPFHNVIIPETNVRDNWLTIEEVKKIRDVKLKNKFANICRDLFMLSYYLGGINVCDVLKLKISDNTIKYIRQKTESRNKVNKYVEFSIPDEAMAIIKKYTDSNGILLFSKLKKHNLDYIFHFFDFIKHETGIKTLMYYSARKSFSQHAFNLGISTSIIDYILGHKLNNNSTSLYHYISVTPEMATDAIHKVLDNLK